MTLLYSYTPSGAGPTTPAPAGGTPTSQSWSNFNQGGSTGAWGLSSNTLTLTTAQSGGYSFTETPANIGSTTDYRTEITLSGGTLTNIVGPIARKQGAAGTSGDHYAAFTFSGVTLWRNSSGTNTQIGGSTAHTWAAGDKLALEVSGTGATVTLKAYINGGSGGTYTTADLTGSDTAAGRIVTTGSAGMATNHTGTTPPTVSLFTVNDLSTASYTVAGPNSAAALPANHNGNIVLTVTKSGGTFAGTETLTVAGVTGWAKVSQSVTAGATTATITVSCPAVASPPAGTTGTLTISDGTLSATIPVNTPTLSLSPSTQIVSGTPSQSFVGGNTLWQGDNPQFSLTGAPAGTSLGASTATTNTSSSATLTTGAATGTATVTDPSTGAQATLTIAAVTPGAVADTNVFFSPYNWYSNGGGALQTNNVKAGSAYAQSSCAGAYVKTKFTGTGITLNYDNSIYGGVANNYPQIEWSIDDGAITSYQLAAGDAGVKALATGLTQGLHKLVLYIKNINANGNGSADAWTWSGTNASLKITSFTLAGSPTSTTAPTLRPKRLIWFGDSISAGLHGAQGDTNTNDGLSSYVARVADALNAEYGLIAYGGTGWIQAAGGVPTFHTVGTAASQSWQWHSLANSRLVSGAFSPAPDYGGVTHGTNDGLQSATNANVQAAANSWLTAMTTAGPTTKWFLTNPFGRFMKTALSGATLASASEFYLDLDASSPSDQLLAQGLGNAPTGDSGGAWGAANGVVSGTASRRAADGLHPNSIGHAEIGAQLAQAIMNKIQPGSGVGGVPRRFQ